jgi:hypothetical protein
MGGVDLSDSIRFHHPRSFEGEEWKMQVAFRNPEELQKLLSEIDAFVHSSRLSKIMAG